MKIDVLVQCSSLLYSLVFLLMDSYFPRSEIHPNIGLHGCSVSDEAGIDFYLWHYSMFLYNYILMYILIFINKHYSDLGTVVDMEEGDDGLCRSFIVDLDHGTEVHLLGNHLLPVPEAEEAGQGMENGAV